MTDRGQGRKTIVQKFGGSSLATPERIRTCALRVRAAHERGDRVVVVVSAMGDTTDDLLDLASQVCGESPAASKRELDQLLATGEQVSIALMALALRALGVPAVSLCGWQCGLRTDAKHGGARIIERDLHRLHAVLDDPSPVTPDGTRSSGVPVVAGFQGLNMQGDITTLGRGGSDTTAVALAAALQADECEIYTDVDGVLTADPRILPEARVLACVPCETMLEAAAFGAQVMHLHAMQLCKEHRVPIRVLHSQRSTHPGTLLIPPGMDIPRAGYGAGIVAVQPEVVQWTLFTGATVDDRVHVLQSLVDDLQYWGVRAQDLGSHVEQHKLVLRLTSPMADAHELRPVLNEFAKKSAWPLTERKGLAKVSIIAPEGSAAAMFRATPTGPFSQFAASFPPETELDARNVVQTSTRLSLLVAPSNVPRAVRTLHGLLDHLPEVTSNVHVSAA